MAKSKSYKAERQLQREDDLVATEQLDVSFQTLVGGGALQSFVRPKGAKMCAPAIYSNSLNEIIIRQESGWNAFLWIGRQAGGRGEEE